MRRRSLLALSLSCAGLLRSRGAWGWVPPSDFLVGRLADRRKSLRTVKVTGIRTFLGRGFESGKQDVAETIWAGANGAYRIERHTPRGEYLEVSDGKRRVTVTDGKPGEIEIDGQPLERLLLLGASKEELQRAMDAFGIRHEITALGRLAERVAWIVGGKEGDSVSPLLWIDKDRSVPLELVDPRTKRRVQFEGWGESAGSGMMPVRVAWYRGGDLEQELRIEETRLNPRLSADLFKPEAPILSAAPSPTATPSPSPSPTPKPPKPAQTPSPKPKPKPTPKPKPKKKAH